MSIRPNSRISSTGRTPHRRRRQLCGSARSDRDTLSIHFTWVRDQAAVDAAAAEIEQALALFSPLPHWGKTTRQHVGRNYAKLLDFARSRERMDPEHKFSNPWLEEVVFGTTN